MKTKLITGIVALILIFAACNEEKKRIENDYERKKST